MKIDYGDNIFDEENDSVTVFRNRFMSYFSVSCKDNCIDGSKYKNYANIDDSGISCVSSQGFITQYGSSYGFHKGYSKNLYVTVDVNGPNKKPNRWGYDTFTFYIPFDSKILMPCKPGVPTGDMYCNSTSNVYNGAGCTVKAMYDANYFKNLP